MKPNFTIIRIVTIAHETWTGAEAIEANESTIDAEIEALAAHWESQGEDASMLRTARDHGDGTWRLDDGSVIARIVQTTNTEAMQ